VCTSIQLKYLTLAGQSHSLIAVLGVLYRYGSEFDSKLIYYINTGVLFDEGDSAP
jgi:hypothetical protein